MMRDEQRPVIYHRFGDLIAARKRRAATDPATLPLVVYRDTITQWSRRVANHHRDFCSLYIVRRGRGAHVIDGVSYAIARGDVYAMGPGMTHHFSDAKSLETETLHFLPSIFDGPTLDALGGTPGFYALFVGGLLRPTAPPTPPGRRWLHLTPSAYAAVEASVAELRAEWSRQTPEGTLLARGLFVRLLVHLARHYTALAGSAPFSLPLLAGPHEATVVAAVRLMEERFACALRIEEIARTVFLSPDRFTEVFVRAMGRTPRDYLRYLRVERAKTLLATTDTPVTQIAQAAGFGEAAYFSRVFRSATGMTPLAFRRNARHLAPV